MRLFLLLCSLLWLPQLSLADTLQRDSIRACRDYFRSLGSAVFTDHITMEAVVARISLGGTLVESTEASKLVLHFPTRAFVVEVDDDLLTYYEHVISQNDVVFAVEVGGVFYLVFPEEAPGSDRVCSQIRLLVKE